MKFAFIEQHRQEFPVQTMCKVLDVSSSGYYAFRHRKPSARSKEEQRLLVYIRAAHRASRETYGTRRIYHELKAQGSTGRTRGSSSYWSLNAPGRFEGQVTSPL